MQRSPFQRTDAAQLGGGEDDVAAMTHADGVLFVGTDTSPAKIAQLRGYLEAVDCVLSDWSFWSECSLTCSGGRKTRSRHVVTPMKYGGKSCAAQGMGVGKDVRGFKGAKSYGKGGGPYSMK